jgi:hypothetical protein
VLFIQKEMFKDHFFGTMQLVELEPFKPEELVDAYKNMQGATCPCS